MNWLIFLVHCIWMLTKKMLAYGVLHGSAVYVIFVFLQSVISEDGRLQRFVHGFCCVQSSSLGCVRSSDSANKIFSRPSIALKPMQLLETRISDLFFSHLPRWWGGQLLNLTPRSAPGKVLHLHGSCSCFSLSTFGLLWSPAAARLLAQAALLPQSWPDPHQDTGSLWLWETGDQVSKGRMAAAILCAALVHKRVLVHVAGRVRGFANVQGREQFSSGANGLREPTAFAQQPPTGLLTPAFTPPCSILAGCSLLTRRWSLGNRSVWSVFVAALVAHRKGLTFGETLDPGAGAPRLWAPK